MTLSVSVPSLRRDAVIEGKGLLSIREACLRAAAHAVPVVGTERLDILDAVGRTLAEPVAALLAQPRFDQSAMDGYALASVSTAGGDVTLPVVGRIAAGARPAPLVAGTAVRIFTGAPLPEGADAVVMQEHVLRRGEEILVPKPVEPGANIRRQGEDIRTGDRLLDPGSRLDARHAALLAAQGIERVAVLRRPRIAVISTGDELRQPGESLGQEAIFDSNRRMLLALAADAGFETTDGGWVPDDPERMTARLRYLSSRVDLIVSSGGASVGEEDHAAAAATAAGGSVEVLKIAMKPGKPAVAGRIGAAAYLGLPGNPVSALVSWLMLGGAMASVLNGRTPKSRSGCPMAAATTFDRRPGRTEFVPARLTEGPTGPALEILGRGGSARLRPLVEADGLAEIAAEHGNVLPGDPLLFHPFHGGFRL